MSPFLVDLPKLRGLFLSNARLRVNYLLPFASVPLRYSREKNRATDYVGPLSSNGIIQASGS